MSDLPPVRAPRRRPPPSDSQSSDAQSSGQSTEPPPPTVSSSVDVSTLHPPSSASSSSSRPAFSQPRNENSTDPQLTTNSNAASSGDQPPRPKKKRPLNDGEKPRKPRPRPASSNPDAVSDVPSDGTNSTAVVAAPLSDSTNVSRTRPRRSSTSSRDRDTSIALPSIPMQTDPQLEADMAVPHSDEEQETGARAADAQAAREAFTLSRKQTIISVEQPENGTFHRYEAGKYDDMKAHQAQSADAARREEELARSAAENYAVTMDNITCTLFSLLVLCLGIMAGFSVLGFFVRYGQYSYTAYMVYFTPVAATLQQWYMGLLLGCTTMALHLYPFFQNKWRWGFTVLVLAACLGMTIAAAQTVDKVEYANRGNKVKYSESDISSYASIDVARCSLLFVAWVVVCFESRTHTQAPGHSAILQGV